MDPVLGHGRASEHSFHIYGSMFVPSLHTMHAVGGACTILVSYMQRAVLGQDQSVKGLSSNSASVDAFFGKYIEYQSCSLPLY